MNRFHKWTAAQPIFDINMKDMGQVKNIKRAHTKYFKDLFWAAKFGDVAAVENHFSSHPDKKNTCNNLDEHQMSPLHYAARGNRVDVVKTLISHDADVNIRGYDGNTPLFMAAKYNSLGTFEVLHLAGAEFKLVDDQGNTLLHEASKLGHLNICKYITENNLLDVSVVDDDLNTPLHQAAMRGRLEICHHLIKNKANLLARAIDGSTPIHSAASKGHTQIILLFLEVSSNFGLSIIDLLNCEDNERQIPLHCSAQGGHVEALEICLKNGSNINSIQKDGWTALHITAANGYFEATKLLIHKGASVNIYNHQYKTPFFLASLYGHLPIMALLIDVGSDVDAVDHTKKTRLMCAAAKGHIAVIDYLFRHNASISSVDEVHRNCLHLAVQNGHVQLIQHLIRAHGIQFLNSTNDFEKTPLHYAVESGSHQIVEILVSNGAIVDSHDDDDNIPLHLACKKGDLLIAQYLCESCLSSVNCLGEKSRTPLHFAVISDSVEVTKMLIKYGADIEKRDGSYMTPLEYAASKGFEQVGKLLLRNGADVNRINSYEETPLHLAASHGSSAVVKLLFESGSDITLCNVNGKTCLDLAIESGYEDAALLIVKHKRSGEILNRINDEGFSVMQTLIEKLPRVAKAVMDLSIERSASGTMDKVIVYDYSLLDPGPALEKQLKMNSKNNPRCNTLTTMIEHKRTGLLLHELSQALLDAKWRTFGVPIYFSNLILYLFFVGALTYYTIALRPPGNIVTPDYNSYTYTVGNQTYTDYSFTFNSRPVLYLSQMVILIFTLVNLITEIAQMYRQKLTYFHEFSNYVELYIYVSSIIFATPPGSEPDFVQWAVGSITVCLTWCNLIVYLQRLSTFGIYVTMLQSALLTVAKVGVMLGFLIIAFGLSFHIILGHETYFSTAPYSFLKVFDMMLGEIDYIEVFFDPINNGKTLAPFNVLALIFLVAFAIILPIAAMNLMVGLAVGDIDKIERNAVLSRLKIQVQFIDQIENSMPYFLRRKFYIGKEEKRKLRFFTQIQNNSIQDVTEVDKSSTVENDVRELKETTSNQEKRRTFGIPIYFINLILCLLLVGALTYFTVALRPFGNIVTYNGDYSNYEYTQETYTYGNRTVTFYYFTFSSRPGIFLSQLIILLFTLVNLMTELAQMCRKKSSYFHDLTNCVELLIYISTIIFSIAPGSEPGFVQWAVGSIAINLVLPTFGIYDAMLQSVLLTIAKVGFMLGFLIIAFGLSFHIKLGHETYFSSASYSFIKVFDMILGELDYIEVFFDPIYNGKTLAPYNVLALIFYFGFIIVMPIAAMNLMVDLAVGDIHKIERNTVLSCLNIQVQFMDQIENSLPYFLRKKFYISKEEKREQGLFTQIQNNLSQDMIEVSQSSAVENDVRELKEIASNHGRREIFCINKVEQNKRSCFIKISLSNNASRIKEWYNSRWHQSQRKQNQVTTVRRSETEYFKDLFWAAKFGDVAAVENHFNTLSDEKNACNNLDEHQMAPLHYAARGNRVDVVKTLVSHGADANIRGYDGNTPLFMAAKYNSLASFEVLHEAGADFKLVDDQGNTVLHEASKLGHLKICKYITEHNLLEVNVMDDDLNTPLHQAAMRGRLEVCQHLLKHKSNLLAQAIDGSTPIHSAASKGHSQVLKLFLQIASSFGLSAVDLLICEDNEKQFPFHRAAQGGHAKAMEICLDNGTNINSVQKDGWSALHITAANGYYEATKLLVDQGAAVNIHNYQYRTPFFLASLYGHLPIMELLIELGSDINAVDHTKKTPLLCAAAKGHIAVIDYLLQRNANISSVDEVQRSCLHLAVQNGHLQLIQHLIRTPAGKFLNSSDNFEKTPLHYAVESGSHQIVEVLVSNGAIVDSHDDDDDIPLHLACAKGDLLIAKYLCETSLSAVNSLGEKSRTPLHFAVINNSVEVTAMLLKYGADVEKRDGSYMTPLEYAASKGFAQVGKLLLQNGADVNRINSRLETPLHLSASQGSSAVVKMLLESGSDITLATIEAKTCLDLAIEGENEEAALLIVKHKRSGEILNRIDSKGYSVMQNLIEKLPVVAKVVMDLSIARSASGSMDKTIVYDYSLLDPGPSVERHLKKSSKDNWRCNALMTMIEHKRTGLLLHELSQALLDAKWRTFGIPIYFSNLILYLLFVGALTYYIIALRPEGNIVTYLTSISSSSTNDLAGTGFTPYTYTIGNETFTEYYFTITSRPDLFVAQLIILIFTSVNLLTEVAQMLRQRLSYFLSYSNYIELFMYITAITFSVPPGGDPDVTQWAIGSINVCLTWCNLIVYLKRLPTFGIYVAMLQSVLFTIAKVGVMLIFLIVAFGLSFHIILGHLNPFKTAPYSFLKVFDMMLGELDYIEVFFNPVNGHLTMYPFNILAFVFLIIVAVVMPIAAMNLMVGLAVGDIDKIERNAVLSRLKIQVQFIDQVENALPYVLMKKFYISKEEKKALGLLTRLQNHFYQNQDVTEVEESNTVENELRDLREIVSNQERGMEMMANQMNHLLKISSEMRGKLNQMAERDSSA
ncbi:Transient receptor potential cation channel subfamily A member 1 [Trichoplax sp. H2]|nr:Transient receptor potential cation channel subfamily A member 1 [Trichoplax sp. H2]|eukprot:RDD43953.1 Transient receptor potential cation channel subfamily A member 1 [Trichoplax sp. H2]